MKKIALFVISTLFICASLFAKGDSYIYDYWGEVEKSPDMYRVSSVMYASDLGLDVSLKNPSGLFCYKNLVYILDSDNNRIIELEYTADKTLVFRRVIDSFNANGADVITTFNSPKDMYINPEDETIFIADTNNSRVVKLDKDLNYLLSFVEPDDPTYEKGKTFMPEKVVTDVKGRAYVLAKNVNKGFIKYEYDGTFTSFYGASEVTYNFSDYLWKKYFSTRAQREQMEQFVPTEYSNAYIDSTGFIFATVKTFSEWDLRSDKAKPIRRLNALGKDILVKNGIGSNGGNLPIGDLMWGNAAGIKGPARFADVTVLDNEVYVVIDETRGRIFGYDNQGYLLYAFGGKGNIQGYFRTPSAIEHCGRDLFVLDSQGCSLTVFTPTDLGHLVYNATEQYAEGKYDDAADTWSEVLLQNGTYDLAYVGIGKSYMRQKKYKDAMDYFGLKRDKKNYSKAFQYYRKEWIEANIGWIIIVLVVVVVAWLASRIVKRLKWEMADL
ncbi:MAG: hypothetical protein MJ181_10425 [Treponema sp.]|nr:hypothetical protein [Treponema sp.]